MIREYAKRKLAALAVGPVLCMMGLLIGDKLILGAGVGVFVHTLFSGIGTHLTQSVLYNTRYLNGKDGIGADGTPDEEDGPWAEDWEKRASREYLEAAFRNGRELANWVENEVGM